MNKLATLAIVILVICGAALWLITPSAFNDFVKTQLETVGSELTQQTVTVKNVDFRLARGMATISGLTITNPPNYQQKNAFTLGTIALDIDIASLTKEPIVLESFTIDNAKAFVELSKKGRANFQDILAAINKNITKTQQPTSNNNEQMEPKVRLEKLILSDIGLTLDLRQLGNKVYQQNLPEINLGSIGGQAGLPVSQ